MTVSPQEFRFADYMGSPIRCMVKEELFTVNFLKIENGVRSRRSHVGSKLYLQH